MVWIGKSKLVELSGHMNTTNQTLPWLINQVYRNRNSNWAKIKRAKSKSNVDLWRTVLNSNEIFWSVHERSKVILRAIMKMRIVWRRRCPHDSITLSFVESVPVGMRASKYVCFYLENTTYKYIVFFHS